MDDATSAQVARLANLDACVVSDALDSLSLSGAVIGIAPTWPVTRIVAGRVRTVNAGPRSTAGPASHIATPLVAIAEPGDVIVIDNRGRTDVSCWGGLLAEAAKQRKVAGVIVEGAVRDIADSEAADLPVFARAAVPVSARGRIVQVAMDMPIQVGNAAVCSGDLVVADRSGVVFVPSGRANEILDIAERLAARESAMAREVRSGRSVVDVMHDSQFTR